MCYLSGEIIQLKTDLSFYGRFEAKKLEILISYNVMPI